MSNSGPSKMVSCKWNRDSKGGKKASPSIFRFTNVGSDATYSIAVRHERLTFDPQTVTVPDAGIRGLVFRAAP